MSSRPSALHMHKCGAYTAHTYTRKNRLASCPRRLLIDCFALHPDGLEHMGLSLGEPGLSLDNSPTPYTSLHHSGIDGRAWTAMRANPRVYKHLQCNAVHS
jgi:hypothetical protein